MSILGVDHSSNKLAVVDEQLHVMSLQLTKKTFNDDCVLAAYDALSRFLSLYTWGESRHAFIEAPTVTARSFNIGVTIKQSRVNGGITVALLEWGFTITSVPPTSWKKELGIGGNATKEQIAEFIQREHPEAWAACWSDEDLLDSYGCLRYGDSLLRKRDKLVRKGAV